MHVYRVHSWCLWKSELVIGYPGTGTGMFVNQYVAAGSESWLLCRNSKCNKITKTPPPSFFQTPKQFSSSCFRHIYTIAFVVVVVLLMMKSVVKNEEHAGARHSSTTHL